MTWSDKQEISWAKSDGIYANPDWYPGSGGLVVKWWKWCRLSATQNS